jgi:LmbE family N-acetylglucosaminyl deacetylase
VEHDIIFTPADHLVVVVAHPDDETFGCGSIVALAASRGARVSVVCATRGEAGEPTERVDVTAGLGTVRERELRTAAQILGVDHVELMGYCDSGFEGPLADRTLCATAPSTLAAHVATVLSRLAPTVVLTLDGCDGHRDHVHLRDAVTSAVRALNSRLFFATIPNSVMRMWLTEKSTAGADTAYHHIDPDRIGRPDRDVTHRVDVSSVLDRRLAAIGAHESQHSPFDGLSEPLRDAFLLTDHLVAGPGSTVGVRGRT